jgi:hypothetical protein
MNSELCFEFSADSWRSLSAAMDNESEEAWTTAIGVFKRRMEERFFNPIKALEDADTKPDLKAPGSVTREECIPGFAIIAICCLLIESIQDFREEAKPVDPPPEPCNFPKGDCIKPESGTNQRFKDFLQLPAFGNAFSNPIASRFCSGIRNGILHGAETRQWVIWRSEPVGEIVAPEQNGYALNRTLFCAAVRAEFDSFTSKLGKPENRALRLHFKTRMDRLAEKA